MRVLFVGARGTAGGRARGGLLEAGVGVCEKGQSQSALRLLDEMRRRDSPRPYVQCGPRQRLREGARSQSALRLMDARSNRRDAAQRPPDVFYTHSAAISNLREGTAAPTLFTPSARARRDTIPTLVTPSARARKGHTPNAIHAISACEKEQQSQRYSRAIP